MYIMETELRKFYKDQSVVYGSSHEYPLFPGTGAENETESEIFLMQL